MQIRGGTQGITLVSPLQCGTIPISRVRRRFISTLAEIEQCRAGRGGLANVFIHKEEFPETLVKERRCGLHLGLGEFLWSRRGITVKGGVLDVATARPESDTTDFVRVCLPRDGVGTRTFRSSSPGKARHGKIEAAPEEVYGTRLSNKARAELLKYAIHRQENSPEFLRRHGVVGRMKAILVKRDCTGDFDRHRPDFHIDGGGSQQ